MHDFCVLVSAWKGDFTGADSEGGAPGAPPPPPKIGKKYDLLA